MISVVIPALNEAERIRGCLSSLGAQSTDLEVFVSDNFSEDETASVARGADQKFEICVRSLNVRLDGAAHFVSAARWALAESRSEYFAFLAADDEWEPGFGEAIISVLEASRVDVAFPTFVWRGGASERVLSPPSFTHERAATRQRAALLLPDWRELANLVYGVYRRGAFEYLVDSLERGDNLFATDFAAAWQVLSRHRVVACSGAEGVRRVRAGADLLERVGLHGAEGAGIYQAVSTYVRLTLRVNRGIARAIRQVSVARHPSTTKVLILRLPQAVWGISRQLRRTKTRARSI